MFDWDQLSVALEAATERLIGTDDLRSHIIVESVQQSTLRDLLQDVASHYLNAAQRKEFCDILADVRAMAGVRNRLVHGRWTLAVKVHNKKAVSSEWLRVFTVTDKETLYTMHDPKHQRSAPLKRKFEYSAQAIHDEAKKIQPLADRLRNLAAQLNVSRHHPPETRSQRRQGARKPKAKRGR